MKQSFRFVSPNGRRWDYLNDRRLRCNAGHHFRDDVTIDETGFIRCHHWLAEERRECDCWIFLFWIRGGGNIVVDVKHTEREAMRRLASPHEKLEWLGIFREATSLPAA